MRCSSDTSKPPSRSRRRVAPLAPVLLGAREFLAASALVDEVRAELAAVETAPNRYRQEASMRRVYRFTAEAESQLRAIAEATPGLRRRCAALGRELGELQQRAAEVAYAESERHRGAVVIHAAARFRPAAAQAGA